MIKKHIIILFLAFFVFPITTGMSLIDKDTKKMIEEMNYKIERLIQSEHADHNDEIKAVREQKDVLDRLTTRVESIERRDRAAAAATTSKEEAPKSQPAPKQEAPMKPEAAMVVTPPLPITIPIPIHEAPAMHVAPAAIIVPQAPLQSPVPAPVAAPQPAASQATATIPASLVSSTPAASPFPSVLNAPPAPSPKLAAPPQTAPVIAVAPATIVAPLAEVAKPSGPIASEAPKPVLSTPVAVEPVKPLPPIVPQYKKPELPKKALETKGTIQAFPINLDGALPYLISGLSVLLMIVLFIRMKRSEQRIKTMLWRADMETLREDLARERKMNPLNSLHSQNSPNSKIHITGEPSKVHLP